MTGSGSGHERYTVFGVYVSQPVYEDLSSTIYEAAGVIDLESYFDPSASSVPAGDPGAEATDDLLATVVEEFAQLYDTADFDAARTVDPDTFVLVHLAGDPETVARARERFRAAATIQETDLRTVQTAILEAALPDTDQASIPKQ